MGRGGLKLIVGLGNPGYEYHLTPHNLGFMAVDRLAEDCGVEINHREAQALTAPTEIEGVTVILSKPQTYMNLSGMSVARILGKHSLSAHDLIVLVDEVNLPLGSIRVRPAGSAGGHNGLKSIIGALGSDEFTRIRMGAQPEVPMEDKASYVLGRFHKSDMQAVSEMIDQSSEAVRIILKDGVHKAMNRFNRRNSIPQS